MSNNADINRRPNLLQLKESGDVEASAHVVLLIYTPMRNDVATGEDKILFGKHRNGPLIQDGASITYVKDRIGYISIQVTVLTLMGI